MTTTAMFFMLLGVAAATTNVMKLLFWLDQPQKKSHRRVAAR